MPTLIQVDARTASTSPANPPATGKMGAYKVTRVQPDKAKDKDGASCFLVFFAAIGVLFCCGCLESNNRNGYRH